ncbi:MULTISPECIES: hypothetical protein [Streptomyces]|uniref:Uncharacterized protein n=2 Tax=Streptomyces rimosus subsp. rimosus TaxID=132474 RepID=L8F1Z7_STRR1|nr:MULTISPECIES: hypothetical protein [Streptomyces]KOG70549.1 hypothetical protein ADK78_28590 [Kitasatospora aureofaciens]KPC73027.1 hypothetical protein ADL35_29165 [Streptomyces sp. NRRL WC-3753]KUJ68455.1 hypothetical protein ACZ90_18795 [Streptomyces albus subsp. albus]MYT47329.1 hypothetical protein [Streptomyces sp. SID5471]KEF04659.1 hypothetical protein DF17_22490 [Streptomyces rimosus]
MAYMEPPEYEDVEPEPSWKCHHCAAVGLDEIGMNAAEYVNDDAPVYLRPHCEACLPTPAGRQAPGEARWQTFYRASGERSKALRDAVENGTLPATAADLIQCPVCGDSFTAGRIGLNLIYAVAADCDESTCARCLDIASPAGIAEAYRRRAAGATPSWAAPAEA